MGIEDVVEDAVPAVKGIKWALYGGIAVLVLMIAGAAYYFYKQHIADQQTIAVQKEVVHEVKQDLKVADISAEASNAGQTVSSDVKAAQATKAVVIRDTLKKRETVIDTTVTDPAVKAEQLAVARMDSVWDTYCQVQPNNEACQQKATPQVAAATDQTQIEGSTQ